VKAITESLHATGFELPAEGMQDKFVPDKEGLKEYYQLGKDMAEHMRR